MGLKICCVTLLAVGEELIKCNSWVFKNFICKHTSFKFHRILLSYNLQKKINSWSKFVSGCSFSIFVDLLVKQMSVEFWKGFTLWKIGLEEIQTTIEHQWEVDRWGSGHSPPKYGTLAYWIFEAEGVWENNRSWKVTLTFPALPFFLEIGHKIPPGEVPSPSGREGAPLALKTRDAKKNPREQALLSPPALLQLPHSAVLLRDDPLYAIKPSIKYMGLLLPVFYFLRGFHVTCDVKVTQSSPTLCDPMDYMVHGILQARILGWVAFPFSRGSSQPRDWTQVSRIAGRFFTS